MNKESFGCCGVAACVRAFALRGVTFMVLLNVRRFCLAVGGATLLTDKPDYVPGEHVIFSGAGWQPGETIEIDTYETSVDPFFWGRNCLRHGPVGRDISNSDFLVQESFSVRGSSCTLPAGPPC